MKYTASVAICTRNRIDSIRTCLARLRQQTYPLLEIVIVDNSDPETQHQIMSLEGDIVRVIRFDGGLGSLPAMRNIALDACSGDVVAFLDDDSFATPDWMQEVVETFRVKNAAGVTGRIVQGVEEVHIPGKPYNCGRFSPARGVFGTFNYICEEVFEVVQFQGTNMAFRREALLQAGGWDLAINGGYGSSEDLSVCLAISHVGGKLYYNQKATVIHGLVPREAGIGRDLSSSESFAEFSTKCYTYLMLKYEKFSAYSITGALSILYRWKRCLFPRVETSYSKRIAAARGVLRGYKKGIELHQRRSR